MAEPRDLNHEENAMRPTVYGVERPPFGFDTLLTLNRDTWRLDPHALLRLIEMFAQQLCSQMPCVHDLESIEAARELIRRDADFQEWAQGYLDSARWAGHDRLDAIRTELIERDTLIRNLQRHAREHGCQYVEEPIAALLAYPLPAPPASPSTERQEG